MKLSCKFVLAGIAIVFCVVSGIAATEKGHAVVVEGDKCEWPRTQQAVVNAICARMGVELDSRTVINSTYMVDYPNDYTMREILGYIAAAHGGCWIITPTGKLRLVTLGVLPAETNYLVDEYGNAITMGGVRILV